MTETSIEITLLPVGTAGLGESPLWDHRSARLWWVDALGAELHACDADGGDPHSWVLPQPIGSIGLAANGLVVALADGFYRFSPDREDLELIARPDMAPETRLNDGKADRFGRFLTASMRTGDAAGIAALFRLDADGACARLAQDISIGNALCFSPAGDMLYFADSMEGVLRRYAYDGGTGRIGAREDLVDCRLHGSPPDGATVDASGNIWVALVLGQALACYSPQGELLRRVDLPVPYPSCPAFGGPDLDILYVTSIANSGHRLVADHPDAGRVTAIRGLGAVGLSEGIYG